MNLFNPKNKLMQAMSSIFDLIVLGLIWLVLCITVIGLGPASTALYYAVTKSVRKGRGKPLTEFFSALKQNWRQSLIIGMLLTVLGIAIYLYDWNYIIALIATGKVQNRLLTALAFLKIFLLFGIANYVFPILSRFNTKIPKAVLISLAFTFRHFLVSIYTVVLLVCAIALALVAPIVSWMIPGIYAWLLSIPMESILRKYTHDEESPNTDQWYLEK